MTIPKTLALYVATGAALCAVLTGCDPDAGQEPNPTPGQGAGAPKSTETVLSDEDLFLVSSRATAPALEAVPDADLQALGQSVCGALDAGVTLAAVGVTMISSGLGATESGAVVGAAIVSMCPEHENLIHG